MTTPSTRRVETLVIGTGISGLFTALKLSEAGLGVLLITKSSLDESNSRYAQGGIAAVLPENAGDSIELHLKDTLIAGAGLCDEAAARSILSEGYAAIEDLLAHGVPFDRGHDRTLELTREAAHSVARILHAGGDATGHSVEMALIEKVKADPRIDVIEYGQVIRLLTAPDGACGGCLALTQAADGTWHALTVASPHTVLATGGLGRLYTHTTNPPIATGDGIALAHGIGAPVQHLEFVQFHPTAFYARGQLHFLVSEALRGEGGVLRDAAGNRFMTAFHPDAELAPRDIVTRALYETMRTSGTPHVWLDITHLPRETIERRFPTILQSCLGFGVDIRTDRIPVAPAAHYLMGGVMVDHHGVSPVTGLYAVGETAYTGLHGANRLASNSLLECVVLARRVARRIAEKAGHLPNGTLQITHQSTFLPDTALQPLLAERHTALRQLMWDEAGIVRTLAGLRNALQRIAAWQTEAEQHGWSSYAPAGPAWIAQLSVARLVVEAALERPQSCGAHYMLEPARAVQPA